MVPEQLPNAHLKLKSSIEIKDFDATPADSTLQRTLQISQSVEPFELKQVDSLSRRKSILVRGKSKEKNLNVSFNEKLVIHHDQDEDALLSIFSKKKKDFPKGLLGFLEIIKDRQKELLKNLQISPVFSKESNIIHYKLDGQMMMYDKRKARDYLPGPSEFVQRSQGSCSSVEYCYFGEEKILDLEGEPKDIGTIMKQLKQRSEQVEMELLLSDQNKTLSVLDSSPIDCDMDASNVPEHCINSTCLIERKAVNKDALYEENTVNSGDYECFRIQRDCVDGYPETDLFYENGSLLQSQNSNFLNEMISSSHKSEDADNTLQSPTDDILNSLELFEIEANSVELQRNTSSMSFDSTNESFCKRVVQNSSTRSENCSYSNNNIDIMSKNVDTTKSINNDEITKWIPDTCNNTKEPANEVSFSLANSKIELIETNSNNAILC
jgi:hypothetical protein